MAQINYSIEDNKTPTRRTIDSIKVNLSKRRVQITVSAFRFVDKDTKQKIAYVPALELSGYGETFQKAEEMLKLSFEEYCKYLLSLNHEQVAKELKSLGWMKDKFLSKQFSRLVVDRHGVLKDVNAEGDVVQELTLSAA
jgi:hypothetical protein